MPLPGVVPIDPAIRAQAKSLYLRGSTPTEVAKAVGVKLATVTKWVNRGRLKHRQSIARASVQSTAQSSPVSQIPAVQSPVQSLTLMKDKTASDVSTRLKSKLSERIESFADQLVNLGPLPGSTAVGNLTRAAAIIHGWGSEAPRSVTLINVDRRRDNTEEPPAGEVVEVQVEPAK